MCNECVLLCLSFTLSIAKRLLAIEKNCISEDLIENLLLLLLL